MYFLPSQCISIDNSRLSWYFVHGAFTPSVAPCVPNPERRSGHEKKTLISGGEKNTLDSDSQRGYNHSWRLCLTPADHRPSLQMPGGRGKHEPELNREEHPLQSSSPSSLNFCCALFALLCRGDLSRFPFAHLDTDLLLYSSRLNTQRTGSGLCHPSILCLYISFSSPGVCFFRRPVDSVPVFLPFCLFEPSL